MVATSSGVASLTQSLLSGHSLSSQCTRTTRLMSHANSMTWPTGGQVTRWALPTGGSWGVAPGDHQPVADLVPVLGHRCTSLASASVATSSGVADLSCLGAMM
jgi:hypothetical protein